MAPVIERISESWLLGEGPHWDQETQSLYYVDVLGEVIHRYVPATKTHTQVSFGTHVSFIIPVEGKSDQFVIASLNEIRLITWDGVSNEISKSEKIAEIDKGEKGSFRFNDGKVDITGRLWTGSVDWRAIDMKTDILRGSLYSFDNHKRIKSHCSDILASNGLAWSVDYKKLYYVDTFEKLIYDFDFDAKSGEVKNRTVLFTLEKHNLQGLPDGQTIDADGNLWVALCNASTIIKIDTGKPETLLETLHLPAKQVTSVTFGGPGLDELYVTTGRVPSFCKDAKAPEDGALYKITGLGVKGLPGVPFKMYP